jgi:peptidoglycan/xylan/chitin deacetylase (PgdA/CDA1 family)
MSALPILTFHAIDERNSVLSYPPAQFENLLKTLCVHGWHCMALSEVVASIRQATPLPARSFALTFDDGYRSVYTHALPVLRSLKLPATLFAISGLPDHSSERLPTLNNREMLNWSELKELEQASVTIGAHTQTHAELPTLSDSEIERELHGSKKILEDKLGVAVNSFAYPKGLYDARCLKYASQYFSCACSDRFDYAHSGSDVYTLERIDSYYLRSQAGIMLTLGNLSGLYVPFRRLMRAVRRTVIGLPTDA